MMETKDIKWFENSKQGDRLDLVLFLLGLTIVFISGFLLYNDVEIVAKRYLVVNTPEVSVASLVSQTHSVSYKNSRTPVWINASNDQSLYSNDKIFTDKNASADILFHNDTNITVGQNSLIVIEQVNNRKNIKIERGNLYVNFAQTETITISLNSREIELTSQDQASLEIKSSETGVMSIASLKGKVNVKQDQSSFEIEKDKKADFNSNGTITSITDIPIQDLSPEHKAIISSQKILDTPFLWKTTESVHEIEMQISKDQDFQKSVVSAQPRTNSVTGINLPQGQYFWRVTGTNKIGKEVRSSTRSLTVYEPQSPQAVYPSFEQRFNPTSSAFGGARKSVVFDWSTTLHATGYRFQLATDKDFVNFIENRNTNQSRLAIKNLEPGRYYWRVQSIYPRSSSEWMQLQTFEITEAHSTLKGIQHNTAPQELKEQTPTPPPPPQLELEYRINPQAPTKNPPKQEHSYILDLLFPSAFAEESPEASEIRWKGVEGAESYDIQISEDENFQKIILEKNSTTPTFRTEGLKSGKYYLRVRTVGSLDQKSVFSKPSVIYVVKPEFSIIRPPDGTNQTKTEKTHSVKFEWKKIQNTSTYYFQLSKSQNFNRRLIDLKLDSNSTTRTFTKSGTFYWRVGYKTPSGTMEFSQTNTFSITPQGMTPPSISPSIMITQKAMQPAKTKIVVKQKEITFPVIKPKRDSTFKVSIALSPTRLESITHSSSGRDKVRLTTMRSGDIEICYSSKQNFSLTIVASLLESSILSNESLVSKSIQFFASRSYTVDSYALTTISPILGYSENIPLGLIKRANGSYSVKAQHSNSILAGVNLSRFLSEKTRLGFEYKHHFLTNSSSGDSSYWNQFDLRWQYNFAAYFWSGISFEHQFGNFNLKNDVEISKILERRQKIKFLFSWEI